MNRQRLFGYILVFLGVYLVLFIFNPVKKDETQNTPAEKTVLLQPVKNEYSFGESVHVNVKNHLDQDITLTSRCPREPLDVYKNGEQISVETNYSCPAENFIIKPNDQREISFDHWNNELFKDEGDYKISYTTDIDGTSKTFETSVKISAPNWFSYGWDLLLYRPIYNTLIFLTTIIPGNDLGWSIILLTILMRVILLIPNQKALEQQKRMQKLQPKLAEIQKKYEGNQQKIGEETMRLWKEHKVNPVGSCLPILIQLPILITLYRAIQNGLSISSTYFLYPPLKNVSIDQINSFFFGILDLSKPNLIVLPILLAILQFIQMKLSFAIAQKKKAKDEKKSENTPMDPNAITSKVMTYVFPLLIAFMSLGFPAGIAVYWGVSTLFGIGQQIWVNREKESRI